MPYTLLAEHFHPIPEQGESRAEMKHFGRTAQDWQTTKEAVSAARAGLSEGQEIKIVFLARHGHGEHNPMPKPVKSHWAGLAGAESNFTILDPLLSPIGHEQAADLAALLRAEVADGMPVPTKVFTSIARRCCGTAIGTWDKIVDPACPFVSLHDLRDNLCGRNASKLAPRSIAQDPFQRILFEALEEEHVQWDSMGGVETVESYTERFKAVFDLIWDQAKGHDCTPLILLHRDRDTAIWRDVFHVAAPSPETGEQRIVVIKKE